MQSLRRYSKKVADEYPWTQVVPDDPHSVTPIPPNYTQNTPKDFLFKAPRKDFQSSGTMFSAPIYYNKYTLYNK